MADIDKLIQDLQSDNPGIRFQACNSLFYEQSIPDRAIEALREATQDGDPVIANAAQRALASHNPETPAIRHADNDQNPEIMTSKNEQISLTCFDLIDLSGWAALMSGITFIVLSFISMYIVGTIYPYYFQPKNYIVGIVFYIIPTFITSVIVTGIVFYIWKKPVLLFGDIVFTPLLISKIIGMICAMVWQLAAIYTYL